jgi:lipopolysaccharide export LptBFGC system permease protein LptF
MISDIKTILKRLQIEETGSYENHFYVIPLQDSNAYARMYTKLDKNAINTEYPEFTKNTSNTTTKIINYFELDEDSTTYNIFLLADFDNDHYYVKIGEKLQV